MLDQHRVEHCVEALCQKGCRQVWGDIEALESGRSLPETDGMTPSEVAAVLHELKHVMAVYEGTCSVN